VDGFAYLSLITDMYSRKIVGRSLSRNLLIEGAMEAFTLALKANMGDMESLIHHLDRGVQYCSHEYVNLLEKNGIKISMTETNHCYENGLAERVNGILKDEFLPDTTFNNFDSPYIRIATSLRRAFRRAGWREERRKVRCK
jgi:transposase InsO family protein